MKAAEVRALNAEQMEARLTELYGEWRDQRFREAVGQMTTTTRIREIRKEIARIKTIQTEVQREATARA